MAESYRKATTKFGNWLRWAMLANFVALMVAFIAFGLAFRGNGLDFAPGDGGPFSGRIIAVQLAFLPLNVASLADRGLLIAWIYQAGKFAEPRGRPAARGRVLGAFSVLIPVVSLWWPYEAVRDAHPPGSSQPFLLKWWVSYLVAPIIGLPVFLTALFGTPLQIVLAISGRRLRAGRSGLVRLEADRRRRGDAARQQPGRLRSRQCSDARSLPSASRRSSCSCIHTVWYESIRGDVSHSWSPSSTSRRAARSRSR